MSGFFQSYWLLGGVIACILAVAVAMSMRRQARTEAGEERMTKLENRFVALEDRVTPVSLAFRQELIAELTHNHTPELDDLLARIDDLTEEEDLRLADLINDRIIEFDDPIITESERDAASMVLMVNKRVKMKARERLAK